MIARSVRFNQIGDKIIVANDSIKPVRQKIEEPVTSKQPQTQQVNTRNKLAIMERRLQPVITNSKQKIVLSVKDPIQPDEKYRTVEIPNEPNNN